MNNNNLVCKARAFGDNVIFSESKTPVTSPDVKEQIKLDKRFGLMEPRVDGYILFTVFSGDDEIHESIFDNYIMNALFAWQIETQYKFRRARDNETPHLTFRFSTEKEDANLRRDTLAYAGYPIRGSEFYGVCVVNKRFYWTIHGKPVSMHLIDPVHYESDTQVMGKTWDLDQVLRHEMGHGVFGLPHDQHTNQIMSSNYGDMSEHLGNHDIARSRAKAGKRAITQRLYQRLKRWYKIRSDR